MELTGRQIRISVRNLVEFVLRSGDIDNRRTAAAPFGGGGRIPNRGRGACGWNHPGWKKCHDR